MLPLETIVCSTDFSEASYEGVKAANELAEHFSAELVLVHVIASIPTMIVAGPAAPSAPAAFNISSYQAELEASSRVSLQDVIDRMVSAGVKADPVIAHGNAADEIVRISEEKGADLVAIATHGQTGWRHLIFGSVAEKVVRSARCAVLTVQAPRHRGED
jgi:nucleotide-binding universal stress UspA family protein